MLIDEIKKAKIQAMKSRLEIDKEILSIVITKYTNLEIKKKAEGLEMTDVDTINIIKKTLKELDDEIKDNVAIGDSAHMLRATRLQSQQASIDLYLPRELSEDEIRSIINSLEDKSIPNVMKHFKTNFAGQVDMALVNKIARGQ